MRRKSKWTTTIVIILIIAALAVGGWFVYDKIIKKSSKAKPSAANETLAANARPIPPPGPVLTPPPASAPAIAPATTALSSGSLTGATAGPASQPTMGAASAQEAFNRGLALAADNKPLQARDELSRAYFSGALTAEQADKARAVLSELADATIFSPRIFDGDPYTFQYTFQPGDIMDKVERKLQLHVPSGLIMRINGIARATAIRAGQTVKMVQGPFHAVVSKGNFTMDIYLQRAGAEKVFIRRFRVGLGKDDGTPVGTWKIRLGGKLRNSPWYPPPTTGASAILRPGDKDYPLGKEGYWISLAGTDPNTSSANGYGIHGTNDPNSIGRATSLGCIRLADPDIDLLFNLLYEEWSTVQVTP